MRAIQCNRVPINAQTQTRKVHLSLINNIRLVSDQNCSKRLTLSDRGLKGVPRILVSQIPKAIPAQVNSCRALSSSPAPAPVRFNESARRSATATIDRMRGSTLWDSHHSVPELKAWRRGDQKRPVVLHGGG
jgi:hypothetical protein